MPENTPKVENIKAYDESDLPTAPAGLEWDVVEVGAKTGTPIDFALLVPVNVAGIDAICKGNQEKAAQLFSRALRIDAPAKLGARERIATARKNGTLTEVMAKLQEEFVNFDVTTIATRAPRKPVEVVAEDKDSYTKAEVAAMLANAKVNFVTK